MINLNINSSIILSFIIVLAIGTLTSISYIQMSHGSPTNPSNGSSPYSVNRTASLIVVKNDTYMKGNESALINDTDRSLVTPNDFIMYVNGNNPSPFEFAGSQSGTNVSIGQGSYAVTESKPQLSVLGTSIVISSNYSKDCTSLIKDGETKTCKVSDVIHFPS